MDKDDLVMEFSLNGSIKKKYIRNMIIKDDPEEYKRI